MSKTKKSSKLVGIVAAISLILIVAGACLGLFLSNVDQNAYALNKLASTSSVNGLILAFGKSVTIGSEGTVPSWAAFPFASISSIGSSGTTYTATAQTGTMIAYILIFVAAALTIVAQFFHKGKFGALILFLAGLCAIAGGIMVFFPIQFATLENTLYDGIGGKSGIQYVLSIGTYLCGICTCVGGAAAAIGGVIKLLK